MPRCIQLEFDIEQSALPVADEGFEVFGDNRDPLFVRGIRPQLLLEGRIVLGQILCDQRKEEIFFILKVGIESSSCFARRFGNILKPGSLETVTGEDAASRMQQLVTRVNGALLRRAIGRISEGISLSLPDS